VAVIARVFTTKSKYTPDDDLAFFDVPDMFTPRVDEVHVSCLFTWDKPRAEELAKQWGAVCDDVRIGGPAFGAHGGEFEPGKYVRVGYVQTSRGCPRRCDFCLVPPREGRIRELEIHDGPWIMDNNLLACSREHQEKVFDMLEGQRGIKFLGGLDTHRLKKWQLDRLAILRKRISFLYLAYDDERDKDSVRDAIVSLYERGFKQSQIWCFVLVGFGEDTTEEAEKRCEWVFVNGAVPFASYYRGPNEENPRKPKDWSELTKRWTYTPVIFSRLKREGPHHHPRILRGNLAVEEEVKICL